MRAICLAKHAKSCDSGTMVSSKNQPTSDRMLDLFHRMKSMSHTKKNDKKLIRAERFGVSW